MTEEIKHGPFTWRKRERDGYARSTFDPEVWELQRDSELPTTFFVLKNYGGQPGPGFKGWKLVSGGPFDSAGAYASFDAALKGVTPWLVEHYRKQARERIEAGERMLVKLREFEAALT